MTDLLKIDRQGPVAVVTLNRPDKQNALSTALLDELGAAVSALDAENDVRGIILTGNEKVFSTGGDLKEGLELDGIDSIRRWLDAFERANRAIESVGTPVIAAIEGYCLTGGLELALCCDIRISGDTAQFGITSSRIGTVAGAGATQRLARLIGPEWTKEILFSGNFIDAATAKDIRLVSEVVPAGQALASARGRIEGYAARAPLSVAYAKFAVNNGLQMDLQSALHYERQITTTMFLTEDKKEGMAAFLEKRPPVFKGR